MAFNTAIRLAAEPLRSRAFGSISGTYAAIGTAFTYPCRILLVQNLTDATLLFSLNGIDDHFPLPPNGFLLIDIESNKTAVGGALNLPAGSFIFVKQSGTPTSGSAYLTTFYGAS